MVDPDPDPALDHISSRLLLKSNLITTATSQPLRFILIALSPCLLLLPMLQDASYQDMIVQLKQSLSAPAWDPEDWQWRPQFLPSTRLPSLSHQPPSEVGRSKDSKDETHQPADVAAASRNEGLQTLSEPAVVSPATTPQSPGRNTPEPAHGSDSTPPGAVPSSLLVQLLNSQAELETPRQALSALQDTSRLGAYQRAIEAALATQPGE